MVRHSAYAGLPSTSPSEGPRQEPYTLTVSVAAVADITSNRKRNLNDAVEREVGEGSEIAYDHITSHNSAYYYGHFLRSGDGIALRVPDETPNVRAHRRFLLCPSPPHFFFLHRYVSFSKTPDVSSSKTQRRRGS